MSALRALRGQQAFWITSCVPGSDLGTEATGGASLDVGFAVKRTNNLVDTGIRTDSKVVQMR